MNGDFKPKLNFFSFLYCVEKVNSESSCCKGSSFLHVLTWDVVSRMNRCTLFWIFNCLEENLHISISFAFAIDDISPGDFE